MALPFFYIPLNISIHLNTIISKCGLVCVYWLQICTLCQLQLLLLQSLFQVIRWHCKTTLLHSTLLTYCFTASPAKTGQCLHICLQHYNILNLYTTHTQKNNSGGEPQHTAYIFASFFGMSFSVFLLGVCNKYKPNSVYHKSTDNMGFLSNEMHPDDVCMNLFMSEADTGKQDRHKSSQVSE